MQKTIYIVVLSQWTLMLMEGGLFMKMHCRVHFNFHIKLATQHDDKRF